MANNTNPNSPMSPLVGQSWYSGSTPTNVVTQPTQTVNNTALVPGQFQNTTSTTSIPSAPVINTATQPIPVNVISNPAPAYTNLPTQTPVAPVVPAPLTFEQFNEQKIKETKPAVDKAYETYLNALGLGETQGQRTISAEEQAGIPQLQKEFTDVTNQINQKDLEFRRQREAISQEAGLTQAQASAKLADVTRKQNSEMADLEVIRASKSNSLANIQNAVSRKLELQFKDETARIDNLKTIYQDVKGDLTKAEDRKVNQLIKQEDRALEQKYREAEKSVDMITNAISQGAPSNVTSRALALQSAGASQVEIAKSLGLYAGDYLGNQLKRVNLAKSSAELNQLKGLVAGSGVNTNSLPNTTAGFTMKLMASARNDKNLDTSERQSLAKAMTVLGQLDSLQQNISKTRTGFTAGRVNKLLATIGQNPNAGVIMAQLQAVVPNLARGVYGEVGVLTDNDITNYTKTIPNLTAPKDQNDAILALTLKTVKNSIENQLRSASNSGVNVSGWVEDYNRISTQINTIEDRIGVSRQAVNNLVASDSRLAPVVKELYLAGLSDGEVLETLNAR